MNFYKLIIQMKNENSDVLSARGKILFLINIFFILQKEYY